MTHRDDCSDGLPPCSVWCHPLAASASRDRANRQQDERVQAVVLLTGGARTWRVLLPNLQDRLADLLKGAKLVAGDPDVLLLLEGTRESLGDTILRLQRTLMGRDLLFMGTTVQAHAPLEVRVLSIDKVSKGVNSEVWADGAQDESDAFVEVDVEWDMAKAGQSGASLGRVEQTLARVDAIDWLTTIKDNHKLLLHVRAKRSQEFDEVLLRDIQGHPLVERTTTMFVLNPGPQLKLAENSNFDPISEDHDRERELDTFVFIRFGHRGIPNVVKDIKAMAGHRDLEIATVYSDTDLVVRLPPTQPGWGEFMFRILTEGLGEMKRSPDFVKFVQVLPAFSKASRQAGITAYVTIDIKRAQWPDKKRYAIEHIKKQHSAVFNYVGSAVNQPRIVGRVTMRSKKELDDFVMKTLRGETLGQWIRGTGTYLIVDDHHRKIGDRGFRTPILRDVMARYPKEDLTAATWKQRVEEFCAAEGLSPPSDAALAQTFSRARRGTVSWIKTVSGSDPKRYRWGVTTASKAQDR